MELNSMDGFTLGSLLVNLISAPLLFLLSQLFQFLVNTTHLVRLRTVILSNYVLRGGAFLLGSAACVAAVALMNTYILHIKIDYLFLGLLMFLIILLARDWRFSRIGIAGAEKSVASGTNYESALSLCRDGFSFLGTGAYKLTTSDGFESALKRCNRNPAKVRLMLSPPDNAILAEAERQAGVTEGTYKKNVVESLKILKRLHDERSLHFEVRFYSARTARDFENFRMMFVNDDLLLLSYNAYGQGDGRNIPQLIVNQKAASKSWENFYYPFKNYYERLWETADQWDFEKYV